MGSLAYGLSLRDLEDLMLERGIKVDPSTVYRWVVHFAPLLSERFNHEKRPVISKWHMVETYIKVRGVWMYLYHAIDKSGATIEFHFRQTRDLGAAKRFIRKAFTRHGRPSQVTIDGSQIHHIAISECDIEARLGQTTDKDPKIVIRN